MTPGLNPETTAETQAALQGVAHAQSCELFDVRTLLEAAIDFTERMKPGQEDNLIRLINMADCKVSSAIAALNDYI